MYDIAHDVPPATNAFLIWSYIFICSCCKKRYHRKYNETIDLVKEDVSQNLNIITVFKRLRMHGFALETLVAAKKRSLLAYLAKRKSTTIIMSCKELALIKNHWSQVENLSSRTRFALGIVNKFFADRENECMVKKLAYEK